MLHSFTPRRACLSLCAALLAAAPPASLAQSPPAAVSLPAAADAFVQQSTPTTNFGMAPTVRVKQGGPVRIAYLKFDIASLAAKEGRVASATLRLYGGNRASGYNAYDTAYAVPDTSWTEGGLTYANRPAPGLRQGTCLSFTAAHYVEWDVTGWVDAQRAAGKSVVSLAVEMDAPPAGAEPDIFNSREAAANRPELRVTVAPRPDVRVNFQPAASPVPPGFVAAPAHRLTRSAALAGCGRTA